MLRWNLPRWYFLICLWLSFGRPFAVVSWAPSYIVSSFSRRPLHHPRSPVLTQNTKHTKKKPFRANFLLAKSAAQEDDVRKETQQQQKDSNTNEVLLSLIARFGFDQRQKLLRTKDLPILAEVYLNGKSELCYITALRPTKDPTVQVKLLHVISGMDTDSDTDTDHVVVDIGQITTVWEPGLDFLDPGSIMDLQKEIQMEWNRFPVGSMEASLDGLYNSHVGRARSTKNSLTKKQIGKLVSTSTISAEKDRLHADTVLRQLIKTGTGCSRLVDSAITAQQLYSSAGMRSKIGNNKNNNLLQQAVAAQLLAQDAEAGGRFKRMPCACVETKMSVGEDGEDTEEVDSFLIINGGWLVVDQSVRAGSEARKFAERVQSNSNSNTEAKDNNTNSQQSTQNGWTISDERIAQRLECLAMGEVFGGGGKDTSSDPTQSSLEVDVREALKALGTPATPEGARDVLVKIGRWSQGQATDNLRFGAQPWSPSVLEAASWYQKKQTSINTASALQEGYSDLTKLPFVCVDAKRTSFRDDAIGVRPRAGTGRKVTDASKFEILVSIADVSDIYVERKSDNSPSSKYLGILREAAASRGVSRYDLPLGPLHLMPPVVLHSLSFNSHKTGSNGAKEIPERCNRCVTVWLYIDDKTGKLMDAGIERSIVSPPVALSYQMATDILDGKLDTEKDPSLRGTGLILAVVERNIMLWSQQRRMNSDAAQKREDRLAVKEFVAKEQLQHQKSRQQIRDDGHDGFQRTRGHRLVDASLDLYAYIVSGLLRRSKAPVPQQAGSGRARGGRVATAPLRRYVDGMAQRQVLSVLCGYGTPMSKAECIRISQEATDAYNTVSNVRSTKNGHGTTSKGPLNQKSALRNLKMHLSGDKRKVVPAVGTGRGNEVVIAGVGALAKCKGVKGTLKPGEEILVQVNRIDVESGNVAVSQAS